MFPSNVCKTAAVINLLARIFCFDVFQARTKKTLAFAANIQRDERFAVMYNICFVLFHIGSFVA